MMTYYPTRDDYEELIIPANFCNLYQSRSYAEFVEIMIPPESHLHYQNKWGTIMVKPTQVCFIPNTGFYRIYINRGAAVVCSVKDDNYNVLTSEELTPEEMIGRFLCYFKHTRQIPCLSSSMDEYTEWKRTGFRLEYALQQILA